MRKGKGRAAYQRNTQRVTGLSRFKPKMTKKKRRGLALEKTRRNIYSRQAVAGKAEACSGAKAPRARACCPILAKGRLLGGAFGTIV